MIELTLRVVFSLAVVLFLMWGLARLVRHPLGGRGAGALAVLTRQPLSRNSSVAVIRVDDRALVLGVTDTQVTLLAEAPLAAFEQPRPVPAPFDGPDVLSAPDPDGGTGVRSAGAGNGPGPLNGSVLSPATWIQAVEFLRDRTSRQR
jgi:flagellar protein FliO/FliZ